MFLELDLKILEAINRFAGLHKWLDDIGRFFTTDGLAILLVLLVILWFLDSGLARKKNQYAVITALEALIFARLLLTPIIKEVWPRLPPFVDHNNIKLLIDQNPLDPSLPGGYAVIAFALAIPVLIYNRKAGLWLMFLALLVSAAWIFVGANYPTDILAALGVAFVSTVFINFNRYIFVAPIVKFLRRE